MCHFFDKAHKKFWMIMRLCVIFVVFLEFATFANGVAQDQVVSLNLKNVSYYELFSEIHKQTGLRFIYNTNQLEKMSLIDVQVHRKKVADVLSEVLAGTPFTCLFDNEVVMLIQREDEDKKGFTIVGKVVDEKKEPMPGVTVKVGGTTWGTATNVKGIFLLVLPIQKGSLEFSFVGYKTKVLHFTENSAQDTLHVVLEEDTKMIDEVIVTGYQDVKEKSMVGAYQKVKAENLVMTGGTTLEQMLQGMLSGVMVLNTSGLTGTRQKVRVRGTSTLLGNAEPVWVVDGIIQEDPLPFESSVLTDISNDNMDMIKNFIGGAVSWLNPHDIADVTVLKDAASTAIYGTKAANGVIVITTKKGERGRLSLSYNGGIKIGERLNYNKMEIMNSKERVDLSREGYLRGALIADESIGYNGLMLAYKRREISFDDFNRGVKELEAVNTDWFDILYRTPFSHNHNLSISGGDNRSTYRASLGVSNTLNTAKGNEQTNYTANLSMSSSFWEKLIINLGLAGSASDTKAFANGVDPFGYAINTSRVIPCYKDGELFYYTKGGYRYNILKELESSGNENSMTSLHLNFNLRWMLVEGLTYTTSLGYGSTSSFGKSWFTDQSNYIAAIREYEYGAYSVTDREFQNSKLPYGGVLDATEMRNRTYNWRNQLEFVRSLGKHVFSAMVGQELSSNKYKGYAATDYGYMPNRGETFVAPPAMYGVDRKIANDKAVQSPVLTDRLTRTLSFYGALSYTYDERYALSGTIRMDGSNRFGQAEKERFQPVWSAGFRWNLTREPWMQQQRVFNDVSLTCSYGFQGNVAESVSPNLITKLERLNSSTGEFSMTISKYPTPNLKWEKTRTINLGLGFSVLGGKVNGSFNYYYKKTTDLITSREVPYENGRSSMTINGGDMKNSGWDLSVSFVPVRTKDFVWSVGLNTGKVRNQVNCDMEPTGQWEEATSGSLNKKGYAVSSFWAFRFTGLNEENGGPEFDFTARGEGDSELDITRYMDYAGKTEPDFTGGINMSFRYRRLTLSSNFYLSVGNKKFLSSPYSDFTRLPSEYENVSSQLKKRWRKPGDKTVIPSIPLPDNSNVFFPFPDLSTRLYPYEAWAYSTVRVVNASYLRCSNISLSYTFPENWGGKFIQNMSISCVLSNPFQIVSKDFEGRDPEVASGMQPLSRDVSLNVSISF